MFPSYVFKIHFKITLPSTPRSSKWSLFSGLPTKTLYASLLSFILATCSAHLIHLHLITRIIVSSRHRVAISCGRCLSVFQPHLLSRLSFLSFKLGLFRVKPGGGERRRSLSSRWSALNFIHSISVADQHK